MHHNEFRLSLIRADLKILDFGGCEIGRPEGF